MELIDELKVALHNLVKLKEHKESKGKDEFYIKGKPIAWMYAKQVLKQCEGKEEVTSTSKCNKQNVSDDEVNSFSLRRFIIRLLPIFIAEWLAPVIATRDSIGNGNYYRLYDAKKPLSGAGILIRYE